MATITASDVKALRDRTGAGMMDCKQALEEAGGDVEKAIGILRRKGASDAAKRSERGTGEGFVASFTHTTGLVGVLVEVQCETDFVARNEDFQAFAREIAVHIAAMGPLAPRYVSVDDIPEDESEAERRAFEEKARADGKPDEVVAKIVEGQVKKWASELALLEQDHFNQVEREGETIQDLLTEIITKTGENIVIARFARFEVGAE